MIIRSISGIRANWGDKAALITLRYCRNCKPIGMPINGRSDRGGNRVGTFNHGVEGSSPSALTMKNKGFSVCTTLANNCWGHIGGTKTLLVSSFRDVRPVFGKQGKQLKLDSTAGYYRIHGTTLPARSACRSRRTVSGSPTKTSPIFIRGAVEKLNFGVLACFDP